MNFHFLEPKGKLYIEVDQCELIRENKILVHKAKQVPISL